MIVWNLMTNRWLKWLKKNEAVKFKNYRIKLKSRFIIYK